MSTVKTLPGRAETQLRRIGPLGTAARVALGGYLVWTVLDGPSPSWVAFALGLIGFPGVLIGWQWWRARRDPRPLHATGPLASVLNFAVVLLLYLTPWYAPPLSATSDAAVIFYGGSMLLAALRGYAGCEVLAVSNRVLRRDDHIGCLVFAPLDHLEGRYRQR